MKLSILPKFNMQADEKELAYEHEQLYKGSNPFLSYILNNMFYILAFLIPLGTFLFLMNHFGFVPFGDLNFFIIDGAYVNLPVLTGLISDLREGSFHLYTLQGSTGSNLIPSILYYLTSPVTLFCLLFKQETAVILLTVFSVLRVCLSGPIFMYYLTHRAIGRKGSKYDPMMLVLSLGYSLSNFALVQYEDFMYLDHFMLFPLLILFMEQFIAKGTWKKFLALNTFLLLSNFYLGLILNIFLVVYYFVKCTGSIEQIIRRFIKFLGILAGSSALSAVTVIPGVYALYVQCHVPATTLTNVPIQEDIFAFFLRHLFYSNPSFMSVAQLGANVYFGIFLLLTASLYFLNSHFALSERIRDSLFLIILILSLNSLQFCHLFHLQTFSDSLYTCYSFVYIFFLLTLAHKVLPRIRTMSLWRLLLSLCLPVFLTILCLNRTNTTPVYESVYYSFALMLFYGILIFLYRIGSSKRDSFFSLVLCIFCLELFANAFQITFRNAKYSAPYTESIVETTHKYSSGENFIRAEMPENAEYAYQKNLLSQFSFSRLCENSDSFPTTSPFADSFCNVRHLYVTNQDPLLALDKNAYQQTGSDDNYIIFENNSCFPASYAVGDILNDDQINSSTYLEKQNSVAKAIGSPSPIYIEDTDITASLSMTGDSSVKPYSLGNNIFALTNQTNPEEGLIVPLCLTFTPNSSGDLYLLIHGSPYYYGTVEAGKTYEHYFEMTSYTLLDNCFWIQFFYVDYAALEALSDQLRASECNIYYKNATSICIETNTKTSSTIVTPFSYDKNFYVSGKNQDITLSSFNNRLVLTVPEGKQTIVLSYKQTPLWIGLLLSFLSLLVCVAVSSKKALHFVTDLYQKAAASFKIAIHAVIRFIRQNYVYVLAFLLPLIGYLFVNALMYIEPFGLYTRFDSDGRAILLPINFATSDMLKNGLPTHSWDGSGGFNTNSVLQIYLCNLIYYFLPESWLPFFTAFFPLICISLSGVSLVYYLTHRFMGKRAHKNDYRLLVPVICYTFCNYMVLNQNNAHWYYIFMILPLLLLAMDYLMAGGKKRYYILALSLSLLTHYYVTMFICFYLIIRFFTYDFKSFTDFIKKGLRFACSSLFTGGLSFFTLYFALSGLGGNTYGAKDSAAPSFGFFHGFEYIINRLAAFYKGFTISWDEGNVNLYFGILPLMLLVLYVTLRKISWKDKLRLLIPYGIFFIALNEAVLNYIFNGLHYPNGVPNRFAFLVSLTAAFMSYDCIRLIDRVTKKAIIFSVLGLMILFVGAYALSQPADQSLLALVSTLLLLLAYGFILCRPPKKKDGKKNKRILLISFMYLEMVINSYYQCSYYFGDSHYTTQMSTSVDYARKQLDIDRSLDRIAFLAPLNDNLGLVNHVNTNTLFSTSLTLHQILYGGYTGCFSGSNTIASLNSQNTVGYAVGNTRYLLLNTQSRSYNMQDTKFFKPIALTDRAIVFENPNCFPFAYYLPKATEPLMNLSIEDHQIWNVLSAIYCDGKDNLVLTHTISNSQPPSKVDVPATSAELTSLTLPQTSEKDDFVSMIQNPLKADEFYVSFACNAPASGSLYAHINDFEYIGDYKAGDRVTHTIDGRSLRFSGPSLNSLDLYTVNNDLLTELCEEVNKHPFQVDSFTDEFVSGSINMPEDGYINFTMPYDERWKIRIDGKEVEAQSLGNGFLTLYAEKGFHEVTMEYVDNRRLPVFLITVGFWILFFAACKISDRRAKNVADKTTENTNEN